MRFENEGKLSPRYIGPYEIMERVGPLAYRLALPPELAKIHNVFHVSMLRKYRSDPSHVLKDSELEVFENLTYVEEPMAIVDYKIKQLRKRAILIVKVIWKHHNSEEAAWETEEKMRRSYPHLFYDQVTKILRTKFIFEGENYNIHAKILSHTCIHFGQTCTYYEHIALLSNVYRFLVS